MELAIRMLLRVCPFEKGLKRKEPRGHIKNQVAAPSEQCSGSRGCCLFFESPFQCLSQLDLSDSFFRVQLLMFPTLRVLLDLCLGLQVGLSLTLNYWKTILL